jgi:4'-phosphopantetheinyl transferase EntD
MLEDLLPTSVISVAVRGDDPSERLHDEEVAQLGWAVESRRREFTTARNCARKALRRLGVSAVAVPRGPRLEPIWPLGVVGSITHCPGFRAAAVALQHDVLTVGIDAEIHDALPSRVLEQVCVDQERAWLAEAREGVHWDRVLFSAKESVYKAWFPLTGRWLGFEDALVILQPEERTFHAHLLVPPPDIAGRTLTGFTGRFSVHDGLIVTAIVLLE